MDSTPPRPSLLSAAKAFIRKSAGTAAVVIAPLAAVTVASTAHAQTLFSSPTVSPSSSGTAFGEANGFSGSVFSVTSGTGANSIERFRVGSSGYFITGSGGGINANVTLSLFSAINNQAINAATVIPVAYDFTLAKQAGTIGNVDWMLHATITDDDSYVIGSGTLTTASATFTGTGNYTVLFNVPGDSSRDFKVYLTLTYTTAYLDEVAITMNSGSQGFTINAAAVPEPSTYAIVFGLGALGLVVVRRSRRAAA